MLNIKHLISNNISFLISNLSIYSIGSGEEANECRRMVGAAAAVFRRPPPCHEIKKVMTATAAGGNGTTPACNTYKIYHY